MESDPTSTELAVLAQVLSILRDLFGLDDLPSDSDMMKSGLLGSLTMVKLFVNLESNFGISVNGSDMSRDNFATPQRVAHFVYEKRESRQPVVLPPGMTSSV